jgi:hypothetical protein
MFDLLLGKTVLMLFGLLAVANTVLPVFFASRRPGSRSVGFPFSFYRHSSAPPPDFGSVFSWGALMLNVVVYYLIAVVIVAAITFLKRRE